MIDRRACLICAIFILSPTLFLAATRELVNQTPIRFLDFGAAATDETHQEVVALLQETDYVLDLPNTATWIWRENAWHRCYPSTLPTPRSGYCMAWDAIRQEVVLFGGNPEWSGNNHLLDETWIWDGSQWSQRTPATRPPARKNAVMAFDEARGVIVLFGGDSNNSAVLSDTWFWNGSDWQQANPPHTPPPRTKTAMAYDPIRQEVVLFGGLNDQLYFGDTWIWDGSDWTEIIPSEAPPVRLNHGMAFDANLGGLVLFGGSTKTDFYSPYLDDTWLWDGTTWRWLSTSRCPSARSCPMMAALPDAEGILLFGGKSQGTNQDDTYIWHDQDWHLVDGSPLPAARIKSCMAYDAHRREAIMFGGQSSPGVTPYSDTWVWDGSHWEARRPNHAPTWSEYSSMAYDAARKRVILFSGSYYGPSQTWLWDGVDWQEVYPEHTPPSRRLAAMVYDEIRQQTVLFGGSQQTDTWIWDGTDWEQVFPTIPPPAGNDPMMVYDDFNSRVMLCGGPEHSNIWYWNGTDWENATPPSSSAYGIYSMAFDYQANRVIGLTYYPDYSTGQRVMCQWDEDRWVIKEPVITPPPNEFYSTVSDQHRKQIILFKSFTCIWNGSSWQSFLTTRRFPVCKPELTVLGDTGDVLLVFQEDWINTWLWRNGNWEQRFPKYSPPLFSPELLFDRRRNQAILTGCQSSLNPGTSPLETWVWQSDQWIRKESANAPLERRCPAFGFDESRGECLLFGGVLTDVISLKNRDLDDTWIWNGLDWEERVLEIRPPKRWNPGMVWYPPLSCLLMFGGEMITAPQSTSYRSDFWSWDGSKWNPIPKPPHAEWPDARGQAAMVYDASRGEVLLYGGVGTGHNLTDLWSWNGQEWKRIWNNAIPGRVNPIQMVYDYKYAESFILDSSGGFPYNHVWALPNGLGDLDDDGDVDATDMLLLNVYLAEAPPIDTLARLLPGCGDLDRDYRITVTDSVILAHYLTGDITELPY